MKSPKCQIVPFVGILLAFMIGLSMQKYQYFPYPYLHKAVRGVEALYIDTVLASHVDTDQILSNQYTYDQVQISSVRNIDTALLPLNATGLRLSEQMPFPKGSGAITAVGDSIIVLDRLGDLYRYAKRNLIKLSFPPIPNNINEYLKNEKVMLQEPPNRSRAFRAYDVKYVPSLKRLVISHEYYDTQYKQTRVALSVIGVDDSSMMPTSAWKTIFLSDLNPNLSSMEGGGKLAMASNGGNKIFLSLGTDLMDSAAQDPKAKFGKIVSVDLATGEDRIISIGHRNPQGLIVTSGGELLSTEQGPAGGDELNLIVEGGNYGYPNVSLGTQYFSYTWQNGSTVGDHKGYMFPIFAWVPSVAASNLIEVKGFNPRWDGDLLVGSLKAMSLFRLRLEQGRVVYSEPVWIGQRIRDIAQLQNGVIALWTDSSELMFLSVDRERLAHDRRMPVATADELTDEKHPCLLCHGLGPTKPGDFAPSLSGVFGRRIASDNWRYSAGLRSKNGIWSEKTLTQFLLNPDKFASGTSMPEQNLSSSEVAALVERLKALAPED